MNKSHAKAIGLFVTGAAFILIVSIFLFSTGELFEKKRHFVAYFNQSVNGLSIGAPVKFRGVEIGEVTMVEGMYDARTHSVMPRVTLVILPKRLTNASLGSNDPHYLQKLIDNGMRASLKSQSLLTGKLYVSLDFYQNKPARKLASSNDKYPELPTVETGLSKFVESLQELPIEQTLTQLGTTLASLDRILKSNNLHRTMAELPGTVAEIRKTSANLERFTRTELPASTRAMETFFVNSDKTVTTTFTKFDTNVIDRLDTTLHEIDKTLKLAQARLDRNDPVSKEMVITLREVSDAAVALRQLAESIEERPESLLKGKKGAKEQK